MEIEIIYEDEFLIAANKPAQMPVHETLDPNRPSLQKCLEKKLGKSLVLFHRLDADTTGLVLLGRDPCINKIMTDMFRDRKIEKTYWAVVSGTWPEELTRVQTFIRKAAGGRWINGGRGKGANTAITNFKLLATNKEKSLIEVNPLTGRTHQIRLHCQYSHHSILGDRLYGQKDKFGVPMALHARSLTFPHPMRAELLKLKAEPPSYWPEHWLKDLGL